MHYLFTARKLSPQIINENINIHYHKHIGIFFTWGLTIKSALFVLDLCLEHMRLIQKHAGLGLKVISDCLQEDICFGRCAGSPRAVEEIYYR